MIHIQNHSTDPYFNLALEEYFFKQAKTGEDIFILWQNDPVIVVGKNQDTLLEINLDYVLENNIKVVRRITGGGTVYHDLGNINFSVIQEIRGGTDFTFFAAPVIAYLKGLGVDASFSGRNDILINDRKISGNAQCYYKNKVLHHGTLLFNSDLGVLSKALNPQTQKLNSKGIKSVKSRVANISDYLPLPIPLADFIAGLAEGYDKAMIRREVSEEERETICELANSKYRTHEWNYGDLPETNFVSRKRFAAGFVEIRFTLSDGVIHEIVLSGDFFEGQHPLKLLKQTLRGKEYDFNIIYRVMEQIRVSDYILGLENHEFLSLLFDESLRTLQEKWICKK